MRIGGGAEEGRIAIELSSSGGIGACEGVRGCRGRERDEAEVIGDAAGEELKRVGEFEVRESEICESNRDRIER